LHGDDASVPDWQQRVFRAFRLGERAHRFLFDEHEWMLQGDPERVESALGTHVDHLARAMDSDP
jgi:hypothetical protein